MCSTVSVTNVSVLSKIRFVYIRVVPCIRHLVSPVFLRKAIFSPRRDISRIMIVLFLMPTDLRIEKASFLTHAEYFSPSGVYVIAHNFISRANGSLLRKRRNNAT